MRLRNQPWVKDYLKNEKNYIINNPETYQKKWNEVFRNNNPLHIEIGSGKGQFIAQLAKDNPEINFVAIEKSHTIMGLALKKLNIEPQILHNLKWINYDAEKLSLVFANREVNKIYLNFSDPWPKQKHSKRRLTSLKFIKLFNEILSPNGVIQLKTDNVDFYNFSLESFTNANWQVLLSSQDLYNDKYCVSLNSAKTEYEQKFRNLGHKICYAQFSRGYLQND